LIGADYLLPTFCVDDHTRVSFLIRAEGCSQDTGALVAQIILAVVERRIPLAPFEEDHGEASFGQLFGDDAASGAATNHDRICVLKRHPLHIHCRSASGAEARIPLHFLTS
jgi:hypothetical protein